MSREIACANKYTHSQVTMVICIPDEELRNDMLTSASRLHQTNRSEIHVFGARIFDEVFAVRLKKM